MCEVAFLLVHELWIIIKFTMLSPKVLSSFFQLSLSLCVCVLSSGSAPFRKGVTHSCHISHINALH